MTTPRPLPWTELVAALGDDRFEEIRAALGSRNVDPHSRDAFVLEAAVGRVLRDLVPADAPAEALDSYAGLLHLLYLHWAAGRAVLIADRDRLRERLTDVPRQLPAPPVGASYLQLPERLVWAAPAPGAAHEPLDGIFLDASGERLRVMAVLGFRAGRAGFTTIEADAALPLPPPGPRPGGTAPFATVLPAGERMGFFSVTSEGELAALALLARAEAAG